MVSATRCDVLTKESGSVGDQGGHFDAVRSVRHAAQHGCLSALESKLDYLDNQSETNKPGEPRRRFFIPLFW